MGGRIELVGVTKTDVLVALVILAGMGSILLPAFSNVRMKDARAACNRNLASIGKSMLTYTNDYAGMFPLAGGTGTRWAQRLPSWSAASRSDAFSLGPNGAGGEATISSSLYLLIRHTGAAPKSFLCKRDRGVREFQLAEYGIRDRRLAELWDFGTNPARHCSYAYQMVYSPYKMTTSGESGFAIAADRNPWIGSPSSKVTDFTKFIPDMRPFNGAWEQAEQGNALAHERAGQNVMFLDTHVSFEKRPYCSLEDDNIYTLWDGKDKARGRPPKLGSRAAGEKDSLLVNDPPAPRKP
jgi:type II secretory pathway pseudopilin PulG